MRSATGAAAHEAVEAETEVLLAVLRGSAEAAFQGSSVFLAYAFGSRVWGMPRLESDLDVGYYLARDSERRCLPMLVELAVANGLSAAVGVEVDLRCLRDAPLALRGRVLTEGRRIYCSDEVARVNLERDLLGRYLDDKPKLDALRELRFAALSKKAR